MQPDIPEPAAREHKPGTDRKTIFAASIGNALEWYDFAIYGYLAPIIGKRFFPSEDAFASLIAAFGVFAIGYLARPLGGAILGHIGDKLGRNRLCCFPLR